MGQIKEAIEALGEISKPLNYAGPPMEVFSRAMKRYELVSKFNNESIEMATWIKEALPWIQEYRYVVAQVDLDTCKDRVNALESLIARAE